MTSSKDILKILGYFFVVFLNSVYSIFAQNPVVTNVKFQQRTDGTHIIDIYYDVTEPNGKPMTLSVKTSEDNGATWDYAITKVTGDVGKNILSGINKHIVWDFASEHPNTFGSSSRIKIIADNLIQRYDHLSDNFDDGDFTNNPTWNLTPGGTGCWAPGTREVINGEFHVKDMDSGGCGHNTTIDINLDIPVTSSTKIKFDIKPVYSNVRNGAGDTYEEYPARVWIDLYDSNNKLLSLSFCYNYRGGSSKTAIDYIRVAFPNVPQNVWQTDQTFSIREYFPSAVKIKKITIGAGGWNYESYFDNVSVINQ